jgi:predicted MPP superfamily phosphohydrolase
LSDSALPHTGDSPIKYARPSTYPAMTSASMEKRLLHRALVALNAPAEWSGWLIGCVALVPIGVICGLWWFLMGAGVAHYLATVLLLFTLADVLTLISLRRWRFSFGPVGPQLFTLELPRLAVALLATLAAVLLGPAPGLIGVVVINLGASLALAWGAFVEPQRLGLSRLRLTSDSLPQDSPPLRVLHISDLHVERFGRREEQLLRMVRAIGPDLILLTGDYVNLSYVDDPVARADTRRMLVALSSDIEGLAPGGVYAVLGSPPVDRNSASLFDGLAVRLLRDEVVTIDLPVLHDAQHKTGNRGGRLALVGLDCSHNTKRDAERLAAVSAHAPLGAFCVLLYHSPELIPVASRFGIDLYLCGHTHGGQVRLPIYGALLTSSELGKQFDMGYYQVEDTHLYVSRGIGMEGLGAPRVRFLCPPEITLFSIQGPEDRQE